MSFLGGLVGLASSIFSAKSARKNADHAADQQLDQWTYQQSNKHQLEVDDLKAAGLNPILSANTTGAVSSPSVSPAQSTDFTDGMEKMFSAVSKAAIDKENANTAKNSAEAEWFKAKIEETKANTAKKLADSQIKLDAVNARLSTSRIDEITENIRSSKEITAAQVKKLAADASASHSVSVLNHTRSKLESLLADSSIKKDEWTTQLIKEELSNTKKEGELLEGKLTDPEEYARREYWSKGGPDKYMWNHVFGVTNSATSVARGLKGTFKY